MPEGFFTDWRRLGSYNGVDIFRGILDDVERWYVCCPVCQTTAHTTPIQASWDATAHNATAAHKAAGQLF